MRQATRTIIEATSIAGTLDILSAFVFGGMAGLGPGTILRYVASGPFGDGMANGGVAAAALGLGVHYAIMAAMVAAFVLAAWRAPALLSRPVIAGVLYGLLLYVVMYWGVLPMRFGRFPTIDAWRVGNALFSHIVCVGVPIALVAAARLRRGAPLTA